MLFAILLCTTFLHAKSKWTSKQPHSLPALDSRVAILSFTATGVSQAEANVVNQLFRSSFVSRTSFTVLNRSVMDELLKEKELQDTGCLDTSCIVEIGKILSMQYVIYGSMMKLGTKFYLTIEMVNIETARVAFSTKEVFSNLDHIDQAIMMVLRHFPSKKKKSWVKEKGTVRFGMQGGYSHSEFSNETLSTFYVNSYLMKDLNNVFSFTILKMECTFNKTYFDSTVGESQENYLEVIFFPIISICSGLGINLKISKSILIKPKILVGFQIAQYFYRFNLGGLSYNENTGNDKLFFLSGIFWPELDIVFGNNRSFGIILSIGYKTTITPFEIDINSTKHQGLNLEYKNSFYLDAFNIGLGFQIYL